MIRWFRLIALLAALSAGVEASIILPNCPWDELKARLDRPASVPLKTVLDRYLRRYEAKLEDPTVGVELEGIIPTGKSLGEIAEQLRPLVAAAAGVALEEVRVEGTHVSIYRNGSAWSFEVKEDKSIQPPEGYRDIEITSPILASEQDIQALLAVVKALPSLGMRAEPITGGLHVHTGAGGPAKGKLILVTDGNPEAIRKENEAKESAQVAELAVLFKVCSLVERQLPQAFMVSPQRSSFLQPMDPALLAKIDQGTVTLADLQKTGEGTREKPGLRFTKHGTFEGRHGNSTIDPVLVERDLRFWRALKKSVQAKDPALFKYLSETPEWSVDIHEISRLIGAPL